MGMVRYDSGVPSPDDLLISTQIMFGIGILMFAIASAHLGEKQTQLSSRSAEGRWRPVPRHQLLPHAPRVRRSRGRPGGPCSVLRRAGEPDPYCQRHALCNAGDSRRRSRCAYSSTLRQFHRLMSPQIYHTYVIWGRNWKVATPLVALFIACTSTPHPSFSFSADPSIRVVSGYFVCGLYPSEPLNSSIFDSPLRAWISAFYAMSCVQSSLTTGLMAYRLWSMDRRTARYRADTGGLMPALLILVQSAALQLLAELIVLVLYASGLSLQYIVLETITPLVVCYAQSLRRRIAAERQSRRPSPSMRSPSASRCARQRR